MDVITTHVNADFDALASMVAASKLYPKARLVFPGSQERNVRDFLQQTQFPLLADRLRGFPMGQVARLILVDAKRVGRIGPLKEILANPGLEVHIYDHHPAHPKDIAGQVEVLRDVGATTTILVGLLREQEIPLTPLEATLLALGIYEETGLLTFTNTTEEDLHAAAYLLSRGADLTLVSDFIRRDLTAEQIALLNELITAAETHTIHAVPVVISTASLDKYVGDLALLAHKIRDLENINVLFLLVRMDNRIHLVARSRVEAVDAGEIAAAFGGGGHPTAASATIKDLTLIQAKDRLLQLLRERIRPLRRARDVMVAPLKAIADRSTIGGAAEVMNRFNLGTLPVVRRGELVGLLPRDVVDKAMSHGLHDAPVRDYMSTGLVTVEPDAPLSRVQRLMVERDVGFIPVVHEGRLRGAVTRADLFRYVYEDILRRPTFPQAEEREAGPAYPRTVANLLANRLPPRIQEILRAAGGVADRVGATVYAVGGFVRDLLLGRENLDIDLVVEGDGIAFARALVAALGGKEASHRKFGTAVVTLPDGLRVDVATARTEFYEAPAALPTVEHGSIKMDLYRRDFTINTLAISLNGARYGTLLDFFGGQRDLRDKAIRIIHNLSFVEDPTRILRAARFEARFGFRISRHAEQLITNAIAMGLLGRLSGPRILHELHLIFQEPRPFPILQRLQGMGALAAIHPKLALPRDAARLLDRVGEVLAWYRLLYLPSAPEAWQVFLLALLAPQKAPEARGVLRRLAPPLALERKLTADLLRCRAIERDFGVRRDFRPSRVYRLLAGAPAEVLLLLSARADREEVRRAASDFLTRYRREAPLLRGDDLKAMGFRPGPLFRDILTSLLYARLDGQIRSREEEVAFVRRRFGRALPSELTNPTPSVSVRRK